MPADLSTLIEVWDGLAVVTRYDASARAWIFICLHDNTLGPCTGGTRMRVYPSPADGLLDAMRLAEGMTFKWAALNGKAGGGKAVLAVEEVPTGAARRDLLLRYASLVESLGGGFRTGEDLGTTSSDMQVIAEKTNYVHGFHPQDGSKVDPSPFTARGVFAGLKSAVAQVWGSDELRGRVVLIEGAGNVGINLGKLLAAAGARLLVSEIDQSRAERASRELGAVLVPINETYSAACDVFSPCAVGATLNSRTIPNLRCRVVAGSANNQLEEPADAQRLAERDILYVPDYIVNAGGALSFALMDQGNGDLEAILKRMDDIGRAVTEILDESSKRGESPVAAAERRVRATLARARSS